MSERYLERIKERFSAAAETHSLCGDHTALVRREQWLEVMSFARDELGLDHFIDLTAVDYLGREQGKGRFEVVVHLRSSQSGERLRIKARVPENNPAIDTLCGLWQGANWFERECHEMYGIKFKGHPDLRPLLLYPEFKGYPLRKDYPIDRRQPRVALLAPETKRAPRPGDETPHGRDPGFKADQ